MKWITREKVHVDRVACPWLIQRFIDRDAEFVFVPRNTDSTSIQGGIVFDMTGVELGHHGDDCSFDAIMKKYQLTDNAALVKIQKIVHLADTGKEALDPLAYALELIATGYRLASQTDHETLAKEFHLYDALYAYFQKSDAQ